MDTAGASAPGRGWGPFTGRQLTLIACVAIVSVVVIVPTAALAATGAFSSTTAAPAVTAVNYSQATGAIGVLGRVAANGNVARTGMDGSATGSNGLGVEGAGAKYGVFSDGPLGVAAGKALLCTACVTASDVANRRSVAYDLAAGATGAPFPIPPDRPVQLIGVTTTVGDRGTASATLIRAANSFIEWTGLDSSQGAAPVTTGGYSAVSGTPVLSLDFDHEVYVQINDANTLTVHNASAGERAGTLLITW